MTNQEYLAAFKEDLFQNKELVQKVLIDHLKRRIKRIVLLTTLVIVLIFIFAFSVSNYEAYMGFDIFLGFILLVVFYYTLLSLMLMIRILKQVDYIREDYESYAENFLSLISMSINVHELVGETKTDYKMKMLARTNDSVFRKKVLTFSKKDFLFQVDSVREGLCFRATRASLTVFSMRTKTPLFIYIDKATNRLIVQNEKGKQNKE